MKYTLLLTLLSVVHTARSQDFLNARRRHAIDSVVQAHFKRSGIVGLSIGLVYRGQSATLHYGTTDAGGSCPVSDSTAFHLASVTKLFTATAIMQLAEAGRIRLDDKLADLLPGFYMKDARYKDIRIRHLLSHSSGLMWDNIIKNSPDGPASEAVFLEQLHTKRLNFAPGTQFAVKTYSNVGFDLLGMVVEKVSGQSYDAYVREHILRPAGMYNSTFFYEQLGHCRRAEPQFLIGRGARYEALNRHGNDHKRRPVLDGSPQRARTYEVYGEPYEHNPSGNLIATAQELNRWMQYHLDLYHQRTGTKIISRESLQQMWTPQWEIPGKNTGMGLCWWSRKDPKGGQFYFHAGTNPGFCSFLTVFPEKDAGIAVLCNGLYARDAVWGPVFKQIVDVMLSD